MANEAVCIEAPTKWERYTIADNAAIPYGTLLKVSADPNTAAASAADNDVFAGIMWVAKAANDGITEASVAINGVWDLKDSGAGATLGKMVNLGGANIFKEAVDADFEAGSIIGKLLETAAASEVVRVRVGRVV